MYIELYPLVVLLILHALSIQGGIVALCFFPESFGGYIDVYIQNNRVSHF